MTYTHDEIMALDADALRLAIAEARKMFIPSLTTDEWSIAVDHGMVPDWPGDIAAAWELVEEMGATNPVEVGTGIPYFCRVFDEQYIYTEMFRGEGDTAPLAICRAWLMWKAGR